MTLTGLIIFLADRRRRRVACWGYHKGGRLWPRRQHRSRRYRLADRRLGVWPIGHRCRWTDRSNYSRNRRRDHPARHCRADQASVAPSLLVGGRGGTNAFLPRGIAARAGETKNRHRNRPRAVSSTSQPGRPGLAVVDAHCTPSRGPARDAGITHRRQRTADDSFCGGDKAVHTRNLQSLAKFQANTVDDDRQ